MSTSHTVNRLNALKAKATTIEFKEVKGPAPSADILNLFRDNTAARTDSSNEWIIDVFPNMTPILMYVMLMSIRHANATQQREHSKSSVATICMYHMTIVYGFFLIGDMSVRPASSAHARSWSEISWKSEFAEFLLSLPMPEFLVPILSQFHCFETDRTRNVFFVPSAAGYDHDQFFGRVFPLNMFAAIHDCTATLPGNSSKIDVLRDLYSRVLYTITDPGFTCVIPDLIGVTIDQTTNTTANHMNSKLLQVFNSLINPVLFRDFQRRSTLAALSFKAPVYPTNNINAYDMLFSATPANIRELKVILQAVSAIFDNAVPCKTTLGLFIASGSTGAITKHGYSTFALPTWAHNDNSTKTNLFNAITTHTLVSEEERAADICFLQRPANPVAHTHQVTDVIYVKNDTPDVSVPLPANHSLNRAFPWTLRYNTEQSASWPTHNNNDLIQFSDELHTAPSCLVLDTDGDQTMSAYLALLTGKIIESFELDGTTIEMPNAAKSLGMQNCMFADSAIAYKYVRPGSAYRPCNAGTFLPPLNRAAPNSQPRLPAASFLHDRTMVMLPHIQPTIHEAPIGNSVPGLTPRPLVRILRYAQSFIGFRTVSSSSNTAALDAVPGMPEKSLMLWSPYTYTPYESDNWPIPDHSDSRHYYLTNLRSIFGTDTNLIQAKHPYESLPVV